MRGETGDSTIAQKWKQPYLTELNLKDTNMSQEAALYLSQLLASNTTLSKICLDLNPLVSTAIVDEIMRACKRNLSIQKQALLPSAKRELEQLQSLTGNGEECTYEKRIACNAEIEVI